MIQCHIAIASDSEFNTEIDTALLKFENFFFTQCV